MKHAVYCATRNIYGDMEAAAKSLVANSDVDKVHFLIEDAEFPRPLPSIVKCHDVSGQQFFPHHGPNACSSWTWMVLMRAALCHVLKDVDRVLSLDCDAFCVRDASGIWDADVSGKYLAGVSERAKSGPGKQYVNFGVVLFNLEELRDGKADEIIAALNGRRFEFPEQDAANMLCNGRIRELPDEYNSMAFNARVDNPRIVHYAGTPRDAWRENPEARLYIEMSWDEAMELHDSRAYAGPPVLFASNHSLERDEAMRAVFGAYRGPKELVRPVEAIASAKGHPVVVADTLTPYVPDKDFVLVNIGHGITGGKLYGLDERRDGIDPRALAQTDYVINASTETCGIAAGSFGIPEDRVLPLGFPRTDMLRGKRKGDGGTFMARYRRAYLYAPTFRGANDGAHLPRIDWALLDSMLEDDEIIVVKRHYFQREPIVTQDVDRIAEVTTSEGITPYLVDCDVLLTDYSSTLFDAYLLGKPAVLAVDDADEYMATRGMYLEYPHEYCSRWIEAAGNEGKLLEHMRAACVTGMRATEKRLLAKVADKCDGNSARRVCDLIAELAGVK